MKSSKSMFNSLLTAFQSQTFSIYSSRSINKLSAVSGASVPLPTSIKLPNFFGSLPESYDEFRVNESCREVGEESQTWICGVVGDDVGLRGRSETHEIEGMSSVFDRLKPELLAACLFPDAGRIQLRLCTDLLMCILLKEEEERLTDGDGKDHATRFNVSGERRKAYQAGLQELQGSTQAERVSTDFESAVDSYLDFDSASGVRLGQQRKQIWQMLPLCLVEYALDLRCNEPGIQQVDQPPLSDLRKAAEDIVREASILYEIVGQFCYARRHPAGPTSTLSQRTSIQQLWEENEKAFEQSGEVCMRRIEDFVTIQRGIMSSTSDDFSVPKRYARALGHFVRGYLQWCFESEYFLGDEGDRIRLTLKIPLEDDEHTEQQAEGEET